MMKRYILLILFLTCSTTSNAEFPTYSSSNNTLLLPEVSVNDSSWVNVQLIFNTDGTYNVKHHEELSAEDNNLLQKVITHNCSSTNNWSRFSAYKAFVHSEESFCLIGDPIITAEGQKIYQYLFIENGALQIIWDNRLDSSTSNFSELSNLTTIKFGYQSNNVFIEQTNIGLINDETDYVLQLTTQDTEFQYY